MITASHNPKQDNGLKLIEKDGSMLCHEWEIMAEKLVNAEDLAAFLTELSNVSEKSNIKLAKNIFDQDDSEVFVGYDTRESSVKLSQAVEAGITAINGKVRNFGLVTTPQLHWLIQKYSQSKQEVHKDQYIEYFSNAFCNFANLC